MTALDITKIVAQAIEPEIFESLNLMNPAPKAIKISAEIAESKARRIFKVLAESGFEICATDKSIGPVIAPFKLRFLKG